MTEKLKVELKYCLPCGYQLRAFWLAQELLNIFAEDIESFTLTPAGDGIFDLYANGERVFSNREAGHFPDVAEAYMALGHKLE
ncbi:MAG: SelT/SelW/SelH family protein [Chloroflexi bacterium]|nr:SelT/SelW/SelH family protein [Chloroflexota bacterium]